MNTKQEVTPTMLIGAAVALIVLIGLVGWLALGQGTKPLDANQLKAHKMRKERMEGGR